MSLGSIQEQIRQVIIKKYTRKMTNDIYQEANMIKADIAHIMNDGIQKRLIKTYEQLKVNIDNNVVIINAIIWLPTTFTQIKFSQKVPK